jgi:hypothetical protein
MVAEARTGPTPQLTGLGSGPPRGSFSTGLNRTVGRRRGPQLDRSRTRSPFLVLALLAMLALFWSGPGFRT